MPVLKAAWRIESQELYAVKCMWENASFQSSVARQNFVIKLITNEELCRTV